MTDTPTDGVLIPHELMREVRDVLTKIVTPTPGFWKTPQFEVEWRKSEIKAILAKLASYGRTFREILS